MQCKWLNLLFQWSSDQSFQVKYVILILQEKVFIWKCYYTCIIQIQLYQLELKCRWKWIMEHVWIIITFLQWLTTFPYYSWYDQMLHYSMSSHDCLLNLRAHTKIKNTKFSYLAKSMWKCEMFQKSQTDIYKLGYQQ